MTNDLPFHSPHRSWRQKFADAFRGVWMGIHDQSSFRVHFAAATIVLVAGVMLGLNRLEWSLLVLAIGGVLAAEMFNTALEHLAKAVDRTHNPHVGNALDIGSAAVLIAALTSVVLGAIVLGFRLWVVAQSWGL
ncbi:MAG: diacylglycerol kinase family protein [Planctomycetaceae bacterium]|nr:MAG: diacylglycerol kinase family protein [Planctomycetaceae bacterium]